MYVRVKEIGGAFGPFLISISVFQHLSVPQQHIYNRYSMFALDRALRSAVSKPQLYLAENTVSVVRTVFFKPEFVHRREASVSVTNHAQLFLQPHLVRYANKVP